MSEPQPTSLPETPQTNNTSSTSSDVSSVSLPSTAYETTTSSPESTSNNPLSPEAPLLQMLGTPLHLLSPNELSAFVSNLRASRTTAQTFDAKLRAESEVIDEKVFNKVKKASKPKKDLLAEFDL